MQSNVQNKLHSFFSQHPLKTFSKGMQIPTNNSIFFLTSGAVRMFSLSKDSDELTLNIYKSNSLFPMSLLLNPKSKRYNYTALSQVEGYFTPINDFNKFIKNNPEVLFDLLKRIYRGLDGFFIRLESLLVRDAYHRVLTQLIIHTKRFGKLDNEKIIFDWPLTHHELSSQTGLARESVSKEIKKLQNQGLIGYSGKKIFIHDLDKLEKAHLTHIHKLPS